MIEERARVVAVEDGTAVVETERRSACGQCAAGGGCGTALIARFFGGRTTRVRALNRAGAAAGDAVVIGLDGSVLVRAALVLYMAPLAGLLAGAMLAGAAGGTAAEPAGILGGVLGLVGGLAWARRYGLRRGGRCQAVVLRRVQPPGAVALSDVDLQGT